ncbi:PKD domain-containing protein [Peribacillus glennii]|uniref:IPT/TIG domain protein n=1 Tax=Peribacillus glennii TaxID=2303991 RepID=A0A372L8X3_9BACI|nr:IPT/TIG domain protein [Peribacillus glennii]RFU61431.1 IPT/TIG domain protein [Peribacillus glennii]
MEVGPINALNGFPVWYKDENGLRLQLNTDPNDPFSGLTPADLSNPGQPVSFPNNFPGEAFYMLAEAEMQTGTGERARLVLALEAAFVSEIPREGDQIVFGRVRIRVAGLQPNAEYVVTHPYGVDTFIAEPNDKGFGEINFTEDIGGLDGGNFELALNSRIHPFLHWDPNVAPAPPEGYIGDPNVDHPVIGSPLVDRFGEPQNIFRIEGPGIGIGSPDRSTTPGINPDNCIETRGFSLLGKISTISGVDVTRTTYTQIDSSAGLLDVFAKSDVTPQQIEVSGSGIVPATLQGRQGLYFARVSYSGAQPPSSVTVRNVTDNPDSIKEAVPVDFITASANYNNDSQTLIINASSSDKVNPIVLNVSDFGQGNLTIPAAGELTLTLTNVPANVTILSSAGGRTTIPVTVEGGPDNPVGVLANAGQDQTVMAGSQVTLNGTNSTGPITSYHWIQLSGTPVSIVNSETAAPSFTAPQTPETLTFQLTVEGEGGPSTDTVSISVVESAPSPVANAGPDQTVQQGTLVTFNGSAAGLATSFNWEQISGPPVQITNADSSSATLTAPKQLSSLSFELTVSGPGGTSTDTTQVTTLPDNLTVTRAEYRTDDSEWRISGTSDVPGPGVNITMFIGNTLNGTILAQVEVDPLGVWQYRFKPSSVQPDSTTRSISVQSSSGGTLINIPLTIRQ